MELPRRSWLVVALLAGCPSPDQRVATEYLHEGRVLDAAGVWLAAVEADVDDPIAKKHLEQAVPTAWEGELDIAHDFVASGHPDSAITAFRDMLAFHDRVAAVGVTVPDVDDLRAELASAEDAVALDRYNAGVAAATAGKWSDAISAYEAARLLRPDFKDSTARMAEVLRAQGAADVESKHFRSALARYDQAYALASDDESEAWAAAIRVAWGRRDLAEGRCRAAFEGLSSAKGHIADSALAADIETARRCARRELVVAPAQDATGTSLPGIAIGAVLSDQATMELRAHGSEHLRLVDESAPPPAKEDGQRRVVKVMITEMRTDKKDDVVEQHAAAHTFVVCGGDEADQFQEGVGFLCDKAVTVTWTEHVHTRTAHVSGTAKLYDTSGMELAAVPFVGEEVRDGRWSDGFSVAGAPVRIGPEAAVGVATIAGDVPTATVPPRDDATDTDLLLAAVRKSAIGLATEVLKVVDVPETSADPAWLNVVPPSLSPGDLEFRAPEPAEKAEPI
jgi:tetratricopeptide (TPR) repeat protein